MNKLSPKIYQLVIIFVTLGFARISQAEYRVEQNIPLSNTQTFSGPGQYIGSFFVYALSLLAITAVGAIAYGGIQYVASAGNKDRVEKAKSWIYGAVYGIILLLCAYLILYTINPDITSLREPQATQLETVSPPDTNSGGGVTTGPSTVSADVATAATNLKNNSKVAFSTSADCGAVGYTPSFIHIVKAGVGTDAKTDIDLLSSGSSVPVCSPSCVCTGRTTVSKQLLDTTNDVANSTTKGITVTSITGGKHSANSYHYKGQALDIVPKSSNPSDWNAIIAKYNSQGVQAKCDVAGQFMTCSQAVGRSGAHIHAWIP